MPRRLGLATLAGLAAGLVTGDVSAQSEDVTFFVIGKHASYRQTPGKAPEAVDYSFFAEIFLTSTGDASAASLVVPGHPTEPYRDMRVAEGGARDNVLLVTGQARYPDFDTLQVDYPDGEYRVRFRAGGRSIDAPLAFRERPLPTPPSVTVTQQGHDCSLLKPGVDAEVSWSAFAEGRADPNGILDDLVFAILEDADGNRVAHSGRPFTGRPYLTYDDRQFAIEGSILEPGGQYTLSVEHALLDDTTAFDGVPGFTTRAATTRLDIRVAPAGSNGCPAPLDSLSAQVTMFYYDDIEPATRFYGEVLGLEKTLDWDWIRFFATGPASEVGLVRRGDGAWHEPQPTNAVMLSIVTTDIDLWYRRVAGNPETSILKPLQDGGGIRSFLLEDPGGYTVEFFEWLEPRPE